MIIEKYNVLEYGDLESTQTLAREQIANNTLKHGDVISAANQSKGYGRYGKVWLGTEENVAITITLDPQSDNTVLPQITYVAGLAVAQTIRQLNENVKPKIKWVNDILIDNKKVAGILCEVLPNNLVLVGIGVNITANPEIIKIGGGGLLDFGIQVQRTEFINLLLEHFKYYYNQWSELGFIPIRNVWLKYSHAFDEPIKVTQPGSRVLEGTFVNVDSKGQLIIDVGGKKFTIRAGQIE